MNLISQPWIRVTNQQNRLIELSLAETLTQAHLITAIHGQTPLERVALFRLLLAVLYRTCQPETEIEAQYQLMVGQFNADRIWAYLMTWRERFNLFHPTYPFYQVSHPPVSLKLRNINRLFLNYSTGIKGTWHSHIHDNTQLKLTPAQAARAVVTAQSFLTAGGNSGRPDLMFHHAPPLQQTNFILQGPTLFHTLWLHLFPRETTQKLAPFFPNTWPDSNDCPVWEREHPEQPPRQQPRGPLDALTYPSRLIKLMPEADLTIINHTFITQALWIALNVPRFDVLAAYRLVKPKNKPSLVYPVKVETGFLEAGALLNPNNDNLTWPVYNRWRSLVERGVIQANEIRFTATGVECDSDNVALTHRIYDHQLSLPAAVLLDEAQSARFQQYSQATAIWSYIGMQALQAGIQTLHPSRRDHFQSLLVRLQIQLRQLAESHLSLSFMSWETSQWEAIIRHLIEQQTAYLPPAAQAVVQKKLNLLCIWQRKVKQEAYEYIRESSSTSAAPRAAG